MKITKTLETIDEIIIETVGSREPPCLIIENFVDCPLSFDSDSIEIECVGLSDLLKRLLDDAGISFIIKNKGYREIY